MNRTRLAVVLAVICSSLAAEAQETARNLLSNGDFATKADGLPAAWKIGKTAQKVSLDSKDLPLGAGQALRVDVVSDGGSSYGEIYQTVRAAPGMLYRLDGQARSTKAGLGFFSIKLRKGGHEIKRIGLAKSQERWSGQSFEFSSEDADEIQVLCRWEQNQKRGWVGQTCWFAEVKLVEKGAAPPPPAWKIAIGRAAEVKAVEAAPPPVPAASGDLFVTPSGAGKRDGSAWDNALPGNAPGMIQAAWDALAPGKACRIGSGIYVNVALNIASGGSGPDKLKRMVGEDTGGGLPWFIGDWDPSTPDKGATLLSLGGEAGFCGFENLQVARYQFAVHSRKGRHVGLRFTNFDVYEGRFGFYLNGFAYADEADKASHDIAIRDCEFIHFTKSAVRLQAGNYDVRVMNCVADAGGTDWMKESFQICYNVQGDHTRRQNPKDDRAWASEHDIIFINCIARHCIWSKARYWQGDGFLAEGDVRNIAFINCSSFDNADGGWDCKASNAIYVNCAGLRNKMNFRVWEHGFFYNCLSAYSGKKGGSWTGSGVWTTGDLRAFRMTFHNNDERNLFADTKPRGDGEVHKARVTLERCISSCDGPNSGTQHLYVGQPPVAQTDTAEYRPKSDKQAAVGEDPQYVAGQSKSWIGEPPDAFDSRKFGAEKGYQSSMRSAWLRRPPEELVERARALLKHQGWEDFKSKVEKMTAAP